MLVVVVACVLWASAPVRSRAESAEKNAGAVVKPAPVAKPLTDVELLAIMLQVAERIDASIRSGEIDVIHNEDALVRTPYVEFMNDAARATRFADIQGFRAALFQFGGAIVSLHSAADHADQAALERGRARVFETLAQIKAFFPPKTLAAAQALADRHTCPMHPEVVGKRTDVCPKCGMNLDQLVRVLPTAATSARTVRASIRLATPLTAGQPAQGILTLTRMDGSPLAPSDLIEVHAAKIHLLVIDPSLTDYHHEHPRPTGTSGEYAFAFTPRKASGYRAWADLRPYPSGLQEYAIADISGPSEAKTPVNKATASHAEVDGMRFDLVVARPDGTPFTELEPIMETFAHLVAFNEDYETVLHMHPKGAPVVNPDERGGPRLDFQIFSLRPGFYRLFAQVQVGGTSKFVPFGFRVTP